MALEQQQQKQLTEEQKKSKFKKIGFQVKRNPKIWDWDSWTGTKKGESMCHIFSRIGCKF